MKKVLIADDSPFIIKLLNNTLEDQPFEIVAEAFDGQEAVDMFREHNPDIVIMDLIMPNKDGATACREILEIQKDVNIIILSSFMNEIIKKELMNIGISSFISKPFEKDELLTYMNKST